MDSLNTVKNLQRFFSPFGYMDLDKVCSIGNAI